MLVQRGKPVGVMRTHEWAPRVLIANSNLVGDWANWEEFRRLEDLGLTMYGQMTAGSWIYIGTQGILQGTFETFAAVADKRFDGTLAGTITLTAGLGGMGGAQPLAVTMNDGVAICIECDQSRITRRIEHRYLDVQADSLERRRRAGGRGPRRAAAAVDRRARQRRRDAARAARAWTRRSTSSPTRPRRTTRCSTCRSASPSRTGTTRARARTRSGSPSARRSRWPRTCGRWSEFQDKGAEVFDYGNSIRDEARKGGYDRAFEFPGFVPAYIRPLFCEGKGPFRWAALSGDPADIAATDRAILELFPDNERLHKWITMAGERVALPGPAGADLLARVRRAPPRRPEVQRDGRLRRAQGADRDRPRPPRLRLGRLAVPRDRGDARRLRRDRRLGRCSTRWSTPPPARPGSRSTTAAASAWAARSTPARSASPTAPTLAAQKIERVLTNDPGMGVIRHVDAGYDRAVEVAAERGVRIPMSEGREPAPRTDRAAPRGSSFAVPVFPASWHGDSAPGGTAGRSCASDHARRRDPQRVDAVPHARGEAPEHGLEPDAALVALDRPRSA